MKILLSEGCPIFREGMKSFLIKNGHKVDSPETEKSFFELVSPNYNIIIFDLDLLKSRAIDIAKSIDAWTTYSFSHRCRLIASYNDAAEYYLAYLFDAGLRKPFSAEKLIKIINKENKSVERFNHKGSIGFNRSINNNHMV